MIVVIGSPVAQIDGASWRAVGLGAEIARGAAAAGAAVEVVGRVGEDPAGEAVLLSLAESGVGHVAVLRTPGRPTPELVPPIPASDTDDGEPLGDAVTDADESNAASKGIEPEGLAVDAEDLELALRYVPDYRVIVVAAELDPATQATVLGAAGWSGAQLVVTVTPGGDASGLPDTATALERPESDPDGAFARIVAAYAVALDRGDDAKSAFATAQQGAGWAAVPD